MLGKIQTNIHSLGLEPLECLGFNTEQELEEALKALMAERKEEYSPLVQ